MGKNLQKILIVDDEPINLTILGNIFESDYVISIAKDGETGLRLARSAEPPDIILLDIMMPGMDGYEVCRNLQADKRTRDIPVIFVTALGGVADESKGLALGAIDFISKPFHNAIIKARVKNHIFRKKQRDALERGQRHLDSSNQRNLMILQTASEGIFGVDIESNITFINSAALKMIGWCEDEVLGRNSCSIFHHTQSDGQKRSPVECMTHKTIATGQSQESYQDIYWRQDQTSFPVSFSSAPFIEYGEITGAIIVFKDISKWQQLERVVRKSEKNEAFKVLAGGLAHDFNNLLSVIMGSISLVTLNEKTDSQLVKDLSFAEEAAIRAKSLVEKIAIIARTGRFTTKKIDIKEAITQTITLCPTRQSIDYDISIAVDVWPLEVEEVHFMELLKNILHNAQEAMPDGGKISIESENCPDGAKEHILLSEGKYLQLSIQDQGSGISREQRKKIFDPYFSSKDRGNVKGMGLGLSICNAIMAKHNGLIDIIPGDVRGTVVRLYFPVTGECHTQDSRKKEKK